MNAAVRLVLVAICLVAAVRLLAVAATRRRAWRRVEAGIDRAEGWWNATRNGPYDQTRTEVPGDVEPFLGPNGPRTDLRSPKPAMAHLVWGWVLLALAVLIALTVLAQMSSGTY